jgi:CRP/FNR family transcriptional regulator
MDHATIRPPPPRAHPPFLRGLGEPWLERLAGSALARRYRKGSTLFHEGDPCLGFWAVERGSVNVYKISAEGRIQIVDTCSPGDVVALAPAVDGGLHPASAEVREDATLLFFPREALIAAIRATPELGLALARRFAGTIRDMTNRMAGVALRDVRERLAEFLVGEVEARGARRADGTLEVALGARQEEIARRLGTVREVLARRLRSLREEGIIEHARGVVRVRDYERLRRLAEP